MMMKAVIVRCNVDRGLLYLNLSLGERSEGAERVA